MKMKMLIDPILTKKLVDSQIKEIEMDPNNTENQTGENETGD